MNLPPITTGTRSLPQNAQVRVPHSANLLMRTSHRRSKVSSCRAGGSVPSKVEKALLLSAYGLLRKRYLTVLPPASWFDYYLSCPEGLDCLDHFGLRLQLGEFGLHQHFYLRSALHKLVPAPLHSNSLGTLDA